MSHTQLMGWLGMIANPNEIIINIDLAQINTFDGETIDKEKFDCYFTEQFENRFPKASLNLHWIKSQNLSMIECKANNSIYAEEDIEAFIINDIDLSQDIYKD